MIVIDTSALVAIVLGEPAGRLCLEVLKKDTETMLSAGTLAELLVVASRREISEQILGLVDSLTCEIVNVTSSTAIAVGSAYRKWGKGIHPAGLNFGDCFAYVVAKQYSCPLLDVGGAFARTDVRSAL